MNTPSPSRRNRFEIRPTRIEDYPGIRALCEAVYPGIKPWAEEQIRSHLTVFPEGQIVAIERESCTVVGMAASLVVNWEDYDKEGDWRDFTDRGYFRNHDIENGRTLYGAEIMVHPGIQRCGLGGKMYAARRKIAEDLGLLRIRAGARLRGYGKVAARMEPEDYVREVVAGKRKDPTLSFQLRQGFAAIALVGDYLPGDSDSQGWAVLIEWLNPAIADENHRTAQIQCYQDLFGLERKQARRLLRRED